MQALARLTISIRQEIGSMYGGSGIAPIAEISARILKNGGALPEI
jgi:hypothetical protein